MKGNIGVLREYVANCAYPIICRKAVEELVMHLGDSGLMPTRVYALNGILTVIVRQPKTKAVAEYKIDQKGRLWACIYHLDIERGNQFFEIMPQDVGVHTQVVKEWFMLNKSHFPMLRHTS